MVTADGSTLPAWGTQSIKVQFGDNNFIFPFVLAAVPYPILGADFLAHHRLLVDPHNQQVLLSSTLQPLPTSATTTAPSPFIAHMKTLPPPIRDTVAAFPTVFNSNLQSQRPHHGIQHYIATSGPPVFAKARRLDADRLAAAKAEFD